MTTCDSDDGLIAGLVICVILLVGETAVLGFLFVRHKGWIDTTRFNFELPKIRRTRRGNGNGETYQEELPQKDYSKSKPTGNVNMSYDENFSVNTGTGTVTIDIDDQLAGTRTSTVSTRSYLELIVEPDNSPVYENVENDRVMRNKNNEDQNLNVTRESEVYINFENDVSDYKNTTEVQEPEDGTNDEIYTNVDISEESHSDSSKSHLDQIIDEEDGENYFVLEKTDSIKDEACQSNKGNQSDNSENYFVLEPQNNVSN
ncbi:uncharacterized protein [Argopecten irradians]|uniref:uncharacterized protein n=1 Tax=Argopecten irradians TaxID=31199 RepID=UPI003723294E